MIAPIGPLVLGAGAIGEKPGKAELIDAAMCDTGFGEAIGAVRIPSAAFGDNANAGRRDPPAS
jgi:hypothetical protein